MTYFFVDSDGTENVSNITPKRHTEGFWTVEVEGCNKDMLTELPNGTIKKLFGTNITFFDDPIMIL